MIDTFVLRLHIADRRLFEGTNTEDPKDRAWRIIVGTGSRAKSTDFTDERMAYERFYSLSGYTQKVD